MFIVALFRIAKIQKQPKCLSVDEITKKIWHTPTMKYYSTLKRKPFCAGNMDE
jgi:hypothetical protein